MSRPLVITAHLKKQDVAPFHQLIDGPESLDVLTKWLADRHYKISRSAVRTYRMRRQGIPGKASTAPGMMREQLKEWQAAFAWAATLEAAGLEHLRFFITNSIEGALRLELISRPAPPVNARPL